MRSPLLRCLWLLCGWLWCTAALAGEPRNAGHVAPVPLLWKAEGPGGAVVYLLGSFHLLSRQDYPLAPEVEAAYADSQRVLFELPPDEVESPALAAQMLQAARRSDGHRLRDDLDPALWRELQRHAAQQGTDLSGMEGLEIWFVALGISLDEMARQGLDPALGLDRHFMQQAARDGKPAGGLETAAEQIRLLDGMDLDEQRQMLAEALDDARDGNSESRELHAAWRAGDARRLWTEMAAEMRQRYPALYRRINVERNDRWVPRLDRQLQAGQGGARLVGGSPHPLGDDGVGEKLRGRGYSREGDSQRCCQPPRCRAGQ